MSRIRFCNLPHSIRRHYLPTAKIASVWLVSTTLYKIIFANGTQRRWEYKNGHWLMS